MRCIHPAVIVNRHTTETKTETETETCIQGDIEKPKEFGKRTCFEGSKAGTWKVTILDRLDFDLGQKSTVFRCDIDVL